MTSPKLDVEDGETMIAGFISKVWSIVNMKEYDHLISWTESGKTFEVHDCSRFSREILPQYFKHSNFASFVRQLNLYGFRKVAKADQGSLLKVYNDSVEFWHAHFRCGHSELLYLVQRRPVAHRTGNEERKPEITKVMTDLHLMKNKQEGIATILSEVKDENLLLKKEVMALKQKHMHQQKILNKIIHFLISMLYKGRLPTRKGNRLMLTGEEDSTSLLPAAKRPHNLSPAVYYKPAVEAPPTPPASAAYTVSSPSSAADMVPVSLSEPNEAGGNSLFLAEPSLPSADVPLEDLADVSLIPSSDDDILANLDLSAVPPLQLQAAALQPQPTSSNTLASGSSDPMDWLTTHLSHQQQGIDALHGSITGQLSIDPTVLSDLLQGDSFTYPDYDSLDTARLVESLSNPQCHVPHENAVSQQNALVPFNPPYPPLSVGSSLEELLSEEPTINQDTSNIVMPSGLQSSPTKNNS